MTSRKAKQTLPQLLIDIRACALCHELPLGPRPVLQASPSARILIAGQAPGTKVHETGIPFNDPSGDRLRDWLGVDRETFYDEKRIAIVPMGFCYPGRDERGGDKPPIPRCAETWRGRVMPLLKNVRLTLVIGQYAHAWHLGAARRKSLTDTVRNWRAYGPDVLPLPHPSWRNTAWLKRNPWFEADILPVLRGRVRELLADG